jgi:hypothetical protein
MTLEQLHTLGRIAQINGAEFVSEAKGDGYFGKDNKALDKSKRLPVDTRTDKSATDKPKPGKLYYCGDCNAKFYGNNLAKDGAIPSHKTSGGDGSCPGGGFGPRLSEEFDTLTEAAIPYKTSHKTSGGDGSCPGGGFGPRLSEEFDTLTEAAIPYKTKSGVTQYMPSTQSVMRAIKADNGSGFCLGCGKKASSFVEPDAHHYPCSSCKAPKVFGAEQLLLMGLHRDAPKKSKTPDPALDQHQPVNEGMTASPKKDSPSGLGLKWSDDKKGDKKKSAKPWTWNKDKTTFGNANEEAYYAARIAGLSHEDALTEAASKYGQHACDVCKKNGPVSGFSLPGQSAVCKSCFDKAQ